MTISYAVHHRHPLQEQVVDVFVSNDMCIAGGAGIQSPYQDRDGKMLNSVLLCTGANACGKVFNAHVEAEKMALKRFRVYT